VSRQRLDLRGHGARNPTDIPAPGWRDIAKRVWRKSDEDNLSLLSAGVAFFALLAIVPGVVAAVSFYGLFASAGKVEQQARELTRGLPSEARDLLTQQMHSILDTSPRGLGFAFFGGLMVALWSASTAMKHLIDAVNVTYDEHERRSFVKVRGLGLLLALGSAVFVIGAVMLITVVPRSVGNSRLGDGAEWVLNGLRWPVLFVAMVISLALVYKVGPDRNEPSLRWVSPGAIVASVLWVIGSIAFGIYTANFGRYNETYGALGIVIVFMLWLYMTAFVVLVGAEINAEIERQTARATTGRLLDQIGTAGTR